MNSTANKSDTSKINNFSVRKVSNLLNKKNIGLVAFCIIFAIGFVSCFSKSTSPLFDTEMSDSSIFQVIGKYWTKGVLPYEELWDSKGPLIFFINALGYMITNSKMGIYIIQIIFMSVSVLFAFKIFNIKFSYKSSLFLTFLTFITLTYNYEYGNLTEEYTLPAIMASFYFMVKWLINIKENTEHNPKYAFVYGVCFSMSFLTRISNAIGVCVVIAFICGIIIVNRKWKNLLHNAISFILGFSVVSLPFIIYFLANGILDEMLYGTIIYNIGYSNSSNFRFEPHNLDSAIKYLPGYGLFVMSILFTIFNKNNRFFGLVFSVTSLITHIWLSSSFEYPHYCMIELPYFCITILEIKILLSYYKDNIDLRVIFLFFEIIFISFGVLLTLPNIRYNYFDKIYYYNYNYTSSKKPYIDMFNQVPIEDRDSFIAYDVDPSFYLYANVKPAYKFFICQEFAISCNNSLRERVLDTYSNGNVKWILLADTEEKITIQNILDERYSLYDENMGYKLYKIEKYV